MQTIQELDTRIKTLRRQVVQTQERKRRAEAETRQRMLVEKQVRAPLTVMLVTGAALKFVGFSFLFCILEWIRYPLPVGRIR